MTGVGDMDALCSFWFWGITVFENESAEGSSELPNPDVCRLLRKGSLIDAGAFLLGMGPSTRKK